MLVYLLSFVQSATTPEATCDKADCAHEIQQQTKFKRGDLMSIISNITLYSSTKEEYYSFYGQYYVTTDKITLLQVPISGCGPFSAESTLRIHAGQYSSPAIPLLADNNKTIEFYSAIVFLEDGTLKGVSWDTSLSSSACKEGQVQHQCLIKLNKDSDCAAHSPMKVYLAFTGTDSQKVHTTSAQYLPSTFKKFGLGGAFTDATDFIGNLKNQVTGFYSNTIGKVTNFTSDARDEISDIADIFI